MTIFRPSPDDPGQFVEPLSADERIVADALASLDHSWTVYVQPRIGQDRPDFVAVHELLGVCAIDVLDWSPDSHRHTADGVAEQRTTGDEWVRTPVQPRHQAARYRFTIYDQFFALPSDGADPSETVRAVLVLPQCSTEQAAAMFGDTSATGSGRRVAVWGADGLRDHLAEVVCGRGCAHPRPESIQRLTSHIVPSEIVTEPASGTELSADARNIEQNQSGSRVRRVRGAAGSGKTFGLAARAARLAGQGKQVLVLSFNVTLANHLSRLITTRCREQGANPTLVTCSNFHSFCTRVVQDAEQAGFESSAPRGASWPVAIVAKTSQVFEAGFERRFDAVLVDEGQDFKLAWWNLLREHVVVRGGEMLLVTDPTQDIYDRRSWTTEQRMLDAGFSGSWTELKGSYRMPTDLLPLANEFARSHIDGERLLPEVPADHYDIVGAAHPTVRSWRNLDHIPDMGIEIGREVVRLLREHPHLAPRDVAFLCEYHHDGVAAVAEIEAAGYPVHHIFSRDPDDPRRRRKYRFWPEAEAVKGCTVHSLKGWSTPVLVMGIGVEKRSKRMAYLAMTRVLAIDDGRAYVSVVNADKRLADFRLRFSAWAPPKAELRLG